MDTTYTAAEQAAYHAGYRAGQNAPRPRKATPTPVVDKAAMTTEELFAYCKRWAVLGDARFLLIVGTLKETQRATVETLAAELETRKSTKADVELLWSIKQDCRANPRNFNPVAVEKAA